MWAIPDRENPGPHTSRISQQRTAESGRMKHSQFGRNQPALHHGHSTYRAVLGMEPLPLLSEAEI